MSNLAFVALFGAIGSLFRFVLIQAVPKISYLNFPIGTVTVNLIGSFFIGVVASLFDFHWVDLPVCHSWPKATNIILVHTT